MEPKILKTNNEDVEYTDSEVIRVEGGLLGFEGIEEYVLKKDFLGPGMPMLFAIKDPDIRFPLLASRDGDRFYVMILNPSLSKSTANTKAPLFVRNQSPMVLEQSLEQDGSVQDPLGPLIEKHAS